MKDEKQNPAFLIGMSSSFARAIRRIWFVACETAVIGFAFMLIASGGDADYQDPFLRSMFCTWVALLITSLIYLYLERSLAWVGLVTCSIAFAVNIAVPYNIH